MLFSSSFRNPGLSSEMWLFLVLFVYLPFNHFESCFTVRRVGLSPRLRYMTASIARKSVTVAEYSFPSGEEEKKKQGGE